jgi:hypothetical protein
MMWIVTSDRLPFAYGETIGKDDLEGCNIDALVAGEHLAPVASVTPTKKRMPVEPAPDDTASEPEEL